MLAHKQGTSGLTIQERIRAMNETLDSVERMPSTTVGTNDADVLTDEIIFNGSSPLIAAPPATHKRTSVVDIWRKRESNTGTSASVPVETVAATKKLSQTNLSIVRPVRTDNSRRCHETLNDVKTELSLKFLGVAGTTTVNSHTDASEEKKDDKEDDAELISAAASVPVSRTKWNGAMRGVASASPTPPPLPKSNRKIYVATTTASTSPSSDALASAPTPPSPQPSLVKQTNPKIQTATSTFYNHNEEPADLTILPAMSSASSCMESEAAPSSTKRSRKVASIWQKLNTTSSGGTAAVPEVVIPTSSGPAHSSNPLDFAAASPRLSDASVTNTPPPSSYKRSVVDIWQKRVSPASSLAMAAPMERANVDSRAAVERRPNVETMSASSSPERQANTVLPVPIGQSVLKQPSWTKQPTQQASSKHNVDPLTPSPPSVKSARSSYERQWSEHSNDGAQHESNPSIDTSRVRRVESGESRNLNVVATTASFQQGEVKDTHSVHDIASDKHTLDLETKAEIATRQWGHHSVQDNGKVESPMLSAEIRNLSSPDRHVGGRVADRWKARMDACAAEKAQQPAVLRDGSGQAKHGPYRSNSVSSSLSVIPSPSAMSDPGKPKGIVPRQWTNRQVPIKAPPVYSQHDDGEDQEGFRRSISVSPTMSEDSRQSFQFPSSPAKETKVVTSVKLPLVNLTPSPSQARRTVADRYPLSGNSSVTGVGPSLPRAPISPMIKDYVAHTPAGLSRNKVTGRWIESKYVAADKRPAGDEVSPPKPASLPGLRSGTDIIDAWVDSKAEIRHAKGLQQSTRETDEAIQVQAAITSTVIPAFERDGDDVVPESMTPLDKRVSLSNNNNKATSVGKRWSTQKAPSTPNAFDAETVADLLKIASSDTSIEPNRVATKDHPVSIKEADEVASGISAIRERWIKRDIGSAHSIPAVSVLRKNASATKSREEVKPTKLESHSTEASVKDAKSSADLSQVTHTHDMVGNEESEVSTSLNGQSPLHYSRSATNVADRWKKRVARASEETLFVGGSAHAYQSPTLEHSDIQISLVGAVDSATTNYAPSYMGSSPGLEAAKTPTLINGYISPSHSVGLCGPDSGCVSSREIKPNDFQTTMSKAESESGSDIICSSGIDGETVYQVFATSDGDTDHGDTLLPTTSTPEIEKTQSGLISKYSRDSVASLRREIEEASEDAADLIASDSVSLADDRLVGQTCVDEFLHDGIAFIPLSGIKMPIHDAESTTILLPSDEISKRRPKQDPPVEPRKIPQMGSPHQMLDGSPSAHSIPTEGSNASYAFESQQLIAARIFEQDPISPHQIIDAWSQQSSLKSSDARESADLVKLESQPKDISTAERDTTMHSDTVVRPANSSAFAPWNSSAENRSDGLLSEDTPIKSKKNFMLLGRRHLVSRTPKKSDNAEKTSEPAIASSSKSFNDTSENETMIAKDVETKNKSSTDMLTFPSLSLPSRDINTIALLQKSATSHGPVIGCHLSTPLSSNRRSSDVLHGASVNANSTQSSQRSKETLTTTTSSSSTRKLASDKLLNKKRLQSYRRKASKPALVETKSVAPVAEDYLYATESINREFTDDQESQVTGPTPQITPFDSDATQKANSDFAPLSSNSMDEKSFLRSTRSESGHSHLSDYDASAFDDICRTSSSATSSALANKAEILLQQRRRRVAPEDLIVEKEDNLVARNSGFSAPPSASHLVTDEISHPNNIDREEVLLENGHPRLSTRYNTSSRFMDADGSTTSISAPGMTTDGSESIGSSCVQSMETATSGSDSRFFAAKRRLPNTETHNRRLASTVKGPSEVMEEKSVNTSAQSAWDSDWVSDVGLDFNKFALAVDERVTALRDFVGGQVNKQSKKSLAAQRNDLMDVEDVAIEVEYVEDSDNDGDYDEDDDYDDPESDLGICSAPLDKAMKRSFRCSEAKAEMERHFQSTCSEMLPTGQPSFEQKPSSLNGRSGYV